MSLSLYNLTLQRQTATVQCALGQFTGAKSQELAMASGNGITLYRLDSSQGKLVELSHTPMFSIVRSIQPFKIAGTAMSYLCVTSDAGNLTILQYINGEFKPLFNEPYSKTGVRRLSPFDISVDPKGRSLLISSIEKNKLCYVLHRNDDGLIVSSPLEVNRSKILTISTISLDVGYENPQYASLEVDYENNTRQLTFYELDLGLNHVVKKQSQHVPATASLLIQVPGGNDGPGGLLVCSEGLISYRNLHDDKLSIAVPSIDKNTTSTIVCGTPHRLKKEFFFLLQTEKGDIFKVELLQDMSLQIGYFDTIPMCSQLLIFKSGFLFADVENGDKQLYQFEKLGNDDTFKSHDDSPTQTTFTRTELSNLSMIDLLESLSPMISASWKNDKLWCLNGTNEQSTLRLLQYGVSISEIVDPDLPMRPTFCFTTKIVKEDEYDKYLVISFESKTLVLTIGESVEEVTDSGLDLTLQTIGIEQIGLKSMIQIHSDGLNIIQNGAVINKWFPPAGIKILEISSNNKQLALGLSNDELIYFEVDQQDKLIEYQAPKQMASKITSLSLGEIPAGLLRSSILVIGCEDSTIRVLSTSPNDTLETLSLQSLSSIPASLLVCTMNGQQCINIGLENGVYVRTILDEQSGELSNTMMKYLGNKPVVLSKSQYNAQNIVLALSNKSWIIHESIDQFKIQQFIMPGLTDVSSFSSEDCPQGLVGVYSKKLVIFNIDSFNEFKKDSMEMASTGKLLLENDDSLFIISNKIQRFETSSMEFSHEVEFNDRILTATVVTFASKNETYLICSTSNGVDHFLVTYSMDLKVVHKTPLPDEAYSLICFQGKLLCGSGSTLRLFDIGIKQLLSKCITNVKTISNIVKLDCQGFRVALGDIRESVSIMAYSSELNQFVLFVDDIISRHMTAMCFLDYDTVIGGDKFGNLFVLRVPGDVSDADPGYLSTRGLHANGAPYKFETLCSYHLNDIPMNFHKTAFTPGGRELVLYTSLLGTIGVLIPLITRSDIKFFKQLEQSLRSEYKAPTDRSHLKYRGYYAPVKNVIDGDFVELFDKLPQEKKDALATATGKKVREISKRVHDVRLGSI